LPFYHYHHGSVTQSRLRDLYFIHHAAAAAAFFRDAI